MDQKHIGVIVILAGIVVAGIVFAARFNEDRYIMNFVQDTGTCYLDDGTCLHEDRSNLTYIAGYSVALSLILFGTYLLFIDKSPQIIGEQHVRVSRALADAKRQERKKDEFSAFLSGFPEDIQKVLKAVREQDGIKQSTLRYRTGISKTGLSLILKDLEEKQIVSRKVAGKTKEVYMQKSF